MWAGYLIYLAICAIVTVAIYINTRSVKSALILGLLLSLAYIKFITSKYQVARAEVENEEKKANKNQ